MSRKLYILILLSFWAFSAQAQEINRLEYFLNTDPGVGDGTPVPVTISGDTLDYNFNVDISQLPMGFHRLYVRTIDDSANWSLATWRDFFVTKSSTAAPGPEIVAAEYYIDSTPPPGMATPIALAAQGDSLNETFAISLDDLSPVFHQLSIRVKDAAGDWSLFEKRKFFVVEEPSSELPAPIVSAEYYFDQNPSLMNPIQIPIDAPSDTVDLDFTIDLSDYPLGADTVYMRVRDANGINSLVTRAVFEVMDSAGMPEMADQVFYIDENLAAGSIVDTIIATDPNNDPITYTIVSGNINDAFALNSNTGILTVNNSMAIDYETTPVFNLIVEAGDGNSAPVRASIEVHLNDLNSIAQTDLSNSIKAYPNPSKGNVFIKTNGLFEQGNYFLFNSSGQLVQSGKVTDADKFYINLPSKAGLYVLRLLENKKQALIKLMKE